MAAAHERGGAAGSVPALSRRDFTWIQAQWRAAGFDAHAVATALAAPTGEAPHKCLPLWLWHTREPTAAHAFIRSFVLGQSLPLAWARTALPQLEGWLTRGLLAANGGRIRPLYSLSFHAGTVLWADVPAETRRPRADHVMGATSATLTLERCLPPCSVESALDFGTGAGLLALRLAARARRVVASDVNPRALALAKWNLALSHVANVEPRVSDRFSGLENQRYDLIVGNLPFVISPGRRFVYRDGGLPGDGFAATAVNEAGLHLSRKGRALFLVQWLHPASTLGDAGSFAAAEEERLASWLSGNGCHGLFLRFCTETIADYTLTWSQELSLGSPLVRASRFARWMSFYERQGIGAISTGLVALRRAVGARPRMLVLPFAAPSESCGDTICGLMDDLAESGV